MRTEPDLHRGRLAIVVPLLAGDLPLIDGVMDRWTVQVPARREAQGKSPFDLVFGFNGRKSESVTRRLLEKLNNEALKEQFAEVRIEFAALDPEIDYYTRSTEGLPRTDQGFKAGPNAMFFHLAEKIGPAYEACFLMELDCIPIRVGWADRVKEEVERLSGAWVIGSRYHGWSWLPSYLAQHLNGNAIYRFSSSEFQAYLAEVWKPCLLELIRNGHPDLAYDCVPATLAELSRGPLVSPELREKVARGYGRFCESSFLLNLGGAIDKRIDYGSFEVLSKHYDSASLIHAGWLMGDVYERETAPDAGPLQEAEDQDPGGSSETRREVPLYSIKNVWVSEGGWMFGNRFAMQKGKPRILLNIIIDKERVERFTVSVRSDESVKIEVRQWSERLSSRFSLGTGVSRFSLGTGVFVWLRKTRLYRFLASKGLNKKAIREVLMQLGDFAGFQALHAFRIWLHQMRGRKIATAPKEVTFSTRSMGRREGVSVTIYGIEDKLIQGSFHVSVE